MAETCDESGRRRFLRQAMAVCGLGAAGPGVTSLLATALESPAPPAPELAPPKVVPDLGNSELTAAYGLDPNVLYFNHGSMGTVPLAVQERHRAYLQLCETNPWAYMWSGLWEETREEVRALAGSRLGCAPSDLAFLHNTTEAFNLLAQGLPLGKGDEVLFSSLNHPGASLPWRHHGARSGYEVREFTLPLARVAELTPDEVVELHVEALRPQTRVLVVPHIDNLVGLRHPLAELSAAVRERGVEWVAVDGAQAVGMIPVDLAASEVDFYATSPHKWLQAPKGLGLFYAREAVRRELQPMWVTWGQTRWGDTARRYEDYGTRNLVEVLALGDAIDFQVALGDSAKEARYRQLWKAFRERTERATGLTWRSPSTFDRGGSLYTIDVGKRPAAQLFQTLWGEHGIVVRPFEAEGLNLLRVSPNLANHQAQVDRFFEALG